MRRVIYRWLDHGEAAVSDWFEIIADVDAMAEEADRLAAEVMAWLVGRNVVMAKPTDCVLGGDGYAPGPNYAAVVIEPDPHLHDLRTNGVCVITGRTVFHSMDIQQIVCPHCGSVVVDDRDQRSWHRFAESIDDWYCGESGVRTCEHCARSVGLNEWQWSPPWAFGYLGFKFWSWPPLAPQFVAEVSSRLGTGRSHPVESSDRSSRPKGHRGGPPPH